MLLFPEFRRQLWLEATTARLITIPVLIGLVAYLTAQGDLSPYKHLFWVSSIAFFLFTIVWGSFKSSQALGKEISTNTWDFQRMSPMSASSLILGKIFGSTIMCWYGGTMSLIIAIPAYMSYAGITGLFNPYILTIISTYIGLALIAQSLPVVITLQEALYKNAERKTHPAIFSVLCAIAMGPFFMFLTEYFEGAVNNSYTFTRYNKQIEWYDFSIRKIDAHITLIWMMVISCFIASWRSMRAELQHRDTPTFWLLGLTAWIAIIAGFADIEPIANDTPVRLVIGFLLLTGAAYSMAFLESNDPLHIRKAIQGLSKPRTKEKLHSIPKWCIAYCLALLIACITPFTMPEYPDREIMSIPLFIITAALLITRDISIIMILRLTPNIKRSTLAIVTSAIFLYSLLPWMEKTLTGELRFFLFEPDSIEPITTFFMAAQCITAVIALYILRLKEQFQNLDNSEKPSVIDQ